MNKVFLLGCHKSGTSLLRSLFDGSDQFFTVPIESHFISMMNWWIDYPFRQQYPKVLDKQSFKSNILKWINYSNKANDPLSDSVTLGLFEEKAAEDFLDKALINVDLKNEKDLINLYFETLYISLNGSNNGFLNKIIIEKSVENFEHAIDLARVFPTSKFIHIIRNPYSNIVSLRKYKTLNGVYPEMIKVLNSISQSYYHLIKNKRNIENYLIIRYEDLVTDTTKEINKICEFLNIKFDENLMQPTFRGEKWKGNSTSSVEFDGIGNTLNKWEKEISPFEIYLVNKFLRHTLSLYDYKHINTPRSPFLRNKGESVKNYIKNRVLLGKIK